TITHILTSNFNECITKGEFPDCLKETVITPNFKEGDKILHQLNFCLDKGQYVVLLFIDLRKAFDLVEHTSMLEILDKLGIRGVSLK
uniref:Reverse transcriptase domain-containing protein n=1 Tax=Megaselia scalaris TaxID=36166 RepID=T1GB27_MEGSC